MWDDDDSEWQDMPVLRSAETATKLEVEKGWKAYREENRRDKGLRPDEVDEDELPEEEEDEDSRDGKKKHSKNGPFTLRPPPSALKSQQVHRHIPETSINPPKSAKLGASNATGNLIDFDEKGAEWREKGSVNEQDYTRLELDEDPEEDEIHTRTQYLFDDDKGMTPLSQMQTTKTMLSEGQRIAYVGLCSLVTREMWQALRGLKELAPAMESTQDWAAKIMGRLYQHMELEPAEQRMIEQLAEHGVTSMDLVPSLVTTHTVPNPEYDPEVEREMLEEREAAEQEEREAREAAGAQEALKEESETHADLADALDSAEISAKPDDTTPPATPRRSRKTSTDEGEQGESKQGDLDNEGDIAAHATPKRKSTTSDTSSVKSTATPTSQPKSPSSLQSPTSPMSPKSPGSNLLQPLPSTLPGVSTNLTAADKTVTLDIRWTVLCDLFLALIADSVYDARSRVLLGSVADKLGLTWSDVIRFERRLTEALEVQEGISKNENGEVIEDRRKAAAKKRYMMMGLATVGGGLVIGLSAGLLAPFIGAGLGAAFATVGVSGTTAFLTGAGGAAVITTGGALTGANIGVRGMARRTKHITVFEFVPLHNNKRLNALITVPGFMNGPQDDVRLPYSTLDPVIGDVFSVLWEPETLGQTGGALKILTAEVLSSVGQQMLQATLLAAMMSALQWPILLTKLGYLIDNPWSNALDRARQAGEVLAHTLMNRNLGVRPVSLTGFSLGARVVFYALVTLAKHKAFGIVQDVYLMGATVTASRKVWREVRGVVSGRFVNAYARNDWVLGYLFRATTGGLSTVAGLRPVEFVPDLENVDVTGILVGHMSYRSLMPQILKHMGFRVTADSFDEPEDLNTVPEREIITPEQLAARLEEQRKAKSWFGRFKKSKSKPGTPTITTNTQAGASQQSTSDARKAYDYDENDSDYFYNKERPERSSTPSTETDTTPRTSVEVKPIPEAPSSEQSVTALAPAPALAVSKGVGFDVEKIRAEIAKDDGSGQLAPGSSATMLSRRSFDTIPRSISGNSLPVSANNSRLNLSSTAEDTAASQMNSIQQQKAQAALEEQEAEYERALAARDAADAALYGRTSTEVPESSDNLQAPYNLSNPFASSTTSLGSTAYPTFTFDHATGAQPSSLSFGGDDGSIEFGSTSMGSGNNTWQTSNSFASDKQSQSDPWSTNEWNSSSKW